MEKPTIQHRRARGMGGSSKASTSSPANGLLLCGSGTTGCHGWTESHPAEAAFLGWRVTQFDDPTHVPVWRTTPLGGEWVLLDDDGNSTPAPDSALAALAALHAEHLTRRTA